MGRHPRTPPPGGTRWIGRRCNSWSSAPRYLARPVDIPYRPRERDPRGRRPPVEGVGIVIVRPIVEVLAEQSRSVPASWRIRWIMRGSNGMSDAGVTPSPWIRLIVGVQTGEEGDASGTTSRRRGERVHELRPLGTEPRIGERHHPSRLLGSLVIRHDEQDVRPISGSPVPLDCGIARACDQADRQESEQNAKPFHARSSVDEPHMCSSWRRDRDGHLRHGGTGAVSMDVRCSSRCLGTERATLRHGPRCSRAAVPPTENSSSRASPSSSSGRDTFSPNWS